MSYWYLAHSDELLIDLDDYMRPTKSGCPWGEAFFRRRLRDAIRDGKLRVREVYLINSLSLRHYHAIIRLDNLQASMPIVQSLVWQLHLGSDLYRGRADLMRYAKGIYAPSLLILPHKIDGFYREPDRKCPCTEKHDTEVQFALGPAACPVWRELRGMSPWELFGRNRKCRERFVPLPTGKVPFELIMRYDLE